MSHDTREPRSVSIGPGQAGGRLDRVVAEAVPELSRSQAARLIEDGRVTVDGRSERSSYRPRAGETVWIELPEPAPTRLVAEAIPLNLVYRDESILVVDKPAGMIVHPAPGHAGGTLANALLALGAFGADRVPGDDVGAAHRPGLVHRLDRDTSGLLVVARDEAALRMLQAQWAKRTVEKAYLALVRGTPREPAARIEAPIGRDPRHRQRMAVVAAGRPATTAYRVVERLRGATLLECRLQTGRTHQIRVHLASIGHPVVGDALYGSGEPALGRQFLHAARLGFRHPRTGEPVVFESPLPPELRTYLERVRSAEC
ncbi:MAG TPA: RluA family pseudouridine synthase [Chloroflexota bacterium]|nr:RluA family pseudouridine synthase [Chloroflexota bacterium]